MPPNADQNAGSARFEEFGRRAFLGAAIAGPFAGQLDQTNGNRTIELAGRTNGWVGRAPPEIEGERNPTLSLTPGATYTVVWENVDGAEHNVVIENEGGDQLVRTEIVERQGATQTVEFTATADMTAYYCEVHPSSMRGRVGTGGTTETETTTPLPEQRAIPMGPTVRLELIAEGMTSPVGFEAAPGDVDLVVVLDQVGIVYRLDVERSNGLAEEPFLDVRDNLVDIGTGTWADYDERGLLGLAFHPEFETNRRFYVRYSAPPREGNPFQDYGHTAVVSEFVASEDGTRGRLDSERIVLEEPLPGPVHNAGGIAFGPDGYCYIGMADGGSTNDVGPGHVEDWYARNPGGNAQNVAANRLGGILRIDVDDREGESAYGVPDDNPLVGRGGYDELYAWGLRNPWRLSFDSAGRLFVSDPGVQRFEEVDIVEQGGNYGWNVKEGTHCFDAENPGDPPEECPDSTPPDVRGGEPLLDPVIEYPHWDDYGNPVGTAAIGGYVYESETVDGLTGGYVFGDFSRDYTRPTGSLFVAIPPEDGGLWPIRKLAIENRPGSRLGRFVFSLGRDDQGELYVLTNQTGGPNGNTGTVHRIVPPGGEPPSTPAEETQVPGGGTASEGKTGDSGSSAYDAGDLYGALAFTGLAGMVSYLLYRRGARGRD